MTVNRVLDRARWGLFAVKADDRRRRRYARWLAAVHRRQVHERRLAAALLPSPSDPIDPAVGFSVARPDASWDLAGVVDQVHDLARDMASVGAQSDEDKPYLLDLPIKVLPSTSPLGRLALNPAVVATAAAHLGMVPVLAGVTVLRSPYVPGSWSGSQLFHSDWEDVNQVKLFVYCSGVTSSDGPLTAIHASASARVKRALHYRYGGPGFRRADDEVLPLVEPDEVQAFEGPAGTAIYADTSACLHYGSRMSPEAPDRLVVQLQFLRPNAFDLVLRQDRLPYVTGTGTEDEWASLVTRRRRS